MATNLAAAPPVAVGQSRLANSASETGAEASPSTEGPDERPIRRL
jgi:hypothetical protein